MTAPVSVAYYLGACLALKVNYLKLVLQVSIHFLRIKSIMLARWARPCLLKPSLQAMIVEQLLAILTLDVLLLHDVEANWTQEWIYEFLVSIASVLLN